MSAWVARGLQAGVKTTRYPHAGETAPGVSPGLPGDAPLASADRVVQRCPTGALFVAGRTVAVDYRRCVHCYRCARGIETPLPWRSGYEWGAAVDRGGRDSVALAGAFSRSLNILVVDAGDCGACLQEVKLLATPYYNMHRLGFFITPTPRNADILLVVGTATAQMRWPLQNAYAAMPGPKRVVAVGACALSGGVFGPSFTADAGVAGVVPVDVLVPGCPPPPLAILHGLLVAAGRRTAAPAVAPAHLAERSGPA